MRKTPRENNGLRNTAWPSARFQCFEANACRAPGHLLFRRLAGIVEPIPDLFVGFHYRFETTRFAINLSQLTIVQSNISLRRQPHALESCVK
jgi:hypothetical protein